HDQIYWRTPHLEMLYERLGATAPLSLPYLSLYRSSPTSERIVLKRGRPNSSSPAYSLLSVWKSSANPCRHAPVILRGVNFGGDMSYDAVFITNGLPPPGPLLIHTLLVCR